MVRAMMVMGSGLAGVTPFMAAYVYHSGHNRRQGLGAHILKVRPATAEGKPSLETQSGTCIVVAQYVR